MKKLRKVLVLMLISLALVSCNKDSKNKETEDPKVETSNTVELEVE